MKNGFSYSTIPPQPSDDMYMRRWVFATPWFTVRLHNILRSDNARHGHNHPWRGFVAFLVKGEYIEEHYVSHDEAVSFVRKPFRPYKRTKRDYHRVMLLDDDIKPWSLVFTWGAEDDWGFLIPILDGSGHCDSNMYYAVGAEEHTF